MSVKHSSACARPKQGATLHEHLMSDGAMQCFDLGSAVAKVNHGKLLADLGRPDDAFCALRLGLSLHNSLLVRAEGRVAVISKHADALFRSPARRACRREASLRGLPAARRGSRMSRPAAHPDGMAKCVSRPTCQSTPAALRQTHELLLCEYRALVGSVIAQLLNSDACRPVAVKERVLNWARAAVAGQERRVDVQCLVRREEAEDRLGEDGAERGCNKDVGGRDGVERLRWLRDDQVGAASAPALARPGRPLYIQPTA